MKTLDPASLDPRHLFTRLLGGDLADTLAKASSRVLVVLPGSTSTKIAFFEGIEKRDFYEAHVPPGVEDSAQLRTDMLVSWLKEKELDPASFDGIAARGGFMRPVPGGTYLVDDELRRDLDDPEIQHPANYGVSIAQRVRELAGRDIPVTVTDPVVVDEVEIESRMTGLREFKTDGTSVHYLSHKSAIRLAASEFGLLPVEASVVSVHLGGGFSLIRQHEGRAVKVINAYSGLPSANRSGALPMHDLLARIQDHQVSAEGLYKEAFREGGLLSLAGTNAFKTLCEFREMGATDQQREKIDLLLRFFAQRTAEGVLAMSAGWGRPDFVCVTGGLSRDREFVEMIEKCLGGLLPMVCVPGSVELESLAAGMALALHAPEKLMDYAGERDRLKAFRVEEDRLIDRQVFRKPILHRKKGSPVRSLDEIIQAARDKVHERFLPTIAVAGSDNTDALAAAMRATEEGEYKIARFLLVGDEKGTRERAARLGMDLGRDDFKLIPSADPVACCLELYENEECHILMKGSVKTTEILGATFHWMRDKGLLHKDALYSHVAVFERKALGRLILMTDAGINVAPDQDEKRRILENALFVARSLNLSYPKVALISAIEKVNPRIVSSVEAGEIAEMYRDRTDCHVEGPISLDVATERDVAEEKSYEGKIRGDADILVMPGIDSGNVVYKTLTTSGHDAAGCIVGGGIPVVLTSRADSALTKLASISLSLRLYFQRMREREDSA